MQTKLSLLTIALAAPLFHGSAAIITVNTVNNISPGVGETSLVQAINQLQDGDTIRFNIPGSGPHYLVTPPMVAGDGGGYPEITKNNVTIDGYSQPGASANTNPILAPNNANIQIVLDSRAGGRHVWNIPGYGTSESGILVVSGNNFRLQGVSLVGVGGADTDADPKIYGVALGKGSDRAHINGCWFGVLPDRTTVAGFNDGVTGFTFTGNDRQQDVTIGVKAGSANPRAEFNVMAALEIPIIIEGNGIRISGNFVGYLPDGVTRVPNPQYVDGWEGHVELGRECWNSVIGTDGDGVNDADERNVLSGGVDPAIPGVFDSKYDTILEFYGGTRRATNVVIAGNYIGLGVDGVPTLSATRILNGQGSTGIIQLGSDMDGVSDALEGNVISMNHPFNVLFPTPSADTIPDFMGLDNGERLSLRGNTLINCNLAPYSYANRLGNRLTAYTTYMANYMNTSVGQPFEIYTSTNPIPVLDTNSTSATLKGFCPPGVGAYTSLYYDLYVADPEGWTNGMACEMWELYYFNGTEYRFYGFPQGRKFLGTFKDNGPQDADPAVAKFQLNIASLGLAPGTAVTMTANYTDAAAAPTATVSKAGSNVVISWPTNSASYTLQQSSALPATWTVVNPQPPITLSGNLAQMTVPASGSKSFFRLSQELKVQTGDFSMPVNLK